MDVDSLLRPGVPNVVDEALRHSVAFATPDGELLPSLQASAMLVTFLPDETARRFLHLAATFIAAKFREDFTPWMVDQAGLFHAWKLMPAEARVAELNALLPPSLRLPAIIDVEHVLDHDTRLATRGLGRLQIRFDENARPLFSLPV